MMRARWITGLGVTLLLTSCVSHPPIRREAAGAEVLVARRGWHIDVGFAAADLTGPLSFVASQFPAARYAFFGFGDERYIRSPSHTVPALLAAIWPGDGVMLVTALDNTPAEAFGASEVIEIAITQHERGALVQFVADTFARSAGRAEPLQSGPYADSVYYAATAGYSGLHTCNTWAAEALRSAGLPVQSRGTLLAGQLWRQLRPLRRAGAD